MKTPRYSVNTDTTTTMRETAEQAKALAKELRKNPELGDVWVWDNKLGREIA